MHRIGVHGTRNEDPREKDGWIGAFCRVYDVESAIAEFIPDIYSKSMDQSSARPRYDYVPGSGHSGCEVYEDGLFFQSYHGTDPAAGQTNAWDLIRTHKFGTLDEEAHHRTSPGNMPSFKAMAGMVEKLPGVVAERNAHLIDGFDDDDEFEDEDEDAGDRGTETPESDHSLDDLLTVSGSRDMASKFEDDDLDGLLGGDPEPAKKADDKADLEWTVHLRTKADGSLEPVALNAALVFQHDVRIKDAIGYNEFTFDPVCLKQIKSRRKAFPLPSDPVSRSDKRNGRKWEDSDDSALNLLCSAGPSLSGYSTDFSVRALQDAVIAAGKRNRIHPVKRFIERLHERWKSEGSPLGYVEKMFIEYLGCPDTPFHREAAYWLCVGAVARIYEPGCKFDTMAIIEGPTGSGKSTFWEVLFGGFVTELKARLDDTGRVVETMRGHWAIEMAEMEAAKKADSNTLKMMLSSTADVHRLAYARREGEYKRQSVFVGSSNEDDYLTDPTSSRRYWVLRTHKSMWDMIDTVTLRANLWRIWGEAYHAYLELREAQPRGSLHLDLKCEMAVRERDQIADKSRKRTVTEIVAEAVEEWLDEPVIGDDIEGPEGTIPDEFAKANDDARFTRHMVTAEMVMQACINLPALQNYRNLDLRMFGKVVGKADGWESIGQQRRHGKKAVWHARGGDKRKDAPLAVLAPAFDQNDDLDELL